MFGKMETKDCSHRLMAKQTYKDGVDEMYAAGLIFNPLLHQRLDEHCLSLAQSGDLNGCVLVSSEGRILLSKGYGMASFEKGIPNTPQTKFRIGSLTKQFTAMAIVKLHELKLLNVDDSISKYVTGCLNGDQITIHHLLTHTSGIPNECSMDEPASLAGQHATPQNMISGLASLPLLFEPGTKFTYSDSGYLLLGYLIEHLSGRSCEDYIHHTLLKPLGMINSGYGTEKQTEIHQTLGETNSNFTHAEHKGIAVPSCARGMYSTIEDLYLWGLALHSQRLIHEQAYDRMTTPFSENYGYGLCVYEDEVCGSNRMVFGHSEYLRGSVSEMKHYKHEDLTVIVLSNIAAPPLGSIGSQLAQIVLETKLSHRLLV